MIYFLTKFQMPNSNGSLVTALKLKDMYILHGYHVPLLSNGEVKNEWGYASSWCSA